MSGWCVDSLLIFLRLLPRAVALLLIIFSCLAVLSPFITLYSLTPALFDFFMNVVVFIPSMSLLLMVVTDLSLLLKGIPVTRVRPVQALSLIHI